MKKHTRIPLVICSLITAQAASAATLAFYDIDDDATPGGGTNSNILAAESFLPGVTATNLSVSNANVVPSTNSDTIFVRWSNAGTVTNVNYIEFTLTPTTVGNTLNLTGFNFEYYYDGSGVAGTGTHNARWDVRANINGGGFADVGANPDATYSTNTNAVPGTLPSASVTLTQTGVTSAIFRLSMYNDGTAQTDANNVFIKTNSITVTGDVVPEPSTALFGILGLAGFLIRRRR